MFELPKFHFVNSQAWLEIETYFGGYGKYLVYFLTDESDRWDDQIKSVMHVSQLKCPKSYTCKDHDRLNSQRVVIVVWARNFALYFAPTNPNTSV